MYKLSIYIPTEFTTPIGEITFNLVEQFGGATQVPSVGYWKEAYGHVVAEPVTVIYTLVPDDKYIEADRMFSQLARGYKVTLKQESILFTCEKLVSATFE